VVLGGLADIHDLGAVGLDTDHLDGRRRGFGLDALDRELGSVTLGLLAGGEERHPLLHLTQPDLIAAALGAELGDSLLEGVVGRADLARAATATGSEEGEDDPRGSVTEHENSVGPASSSGKKSRTGRPRINKCFLKPVFDTGNRL
jgi:hypothetical protein